MASFKGLVRTIALVATFFLAACDSEAETAGDLFQERYETLMAEHPGIGKFAAARVRTAEQFDVWKKDSATSKAEDIEPVTFRDLSKTSIQQYGYLLMLQDTYTRAKFDGRITPREAIIIGRAVRDDMHEINLIENLSRSTGYRMDYAEKARALFASEEEGANGSD